MDVCQLHIRVQDTLLFSLAASGTVIMGHITFLSYEAGRCKPQCQYCTLYRVPQGLVELTTA
jgi:hypothetical protein